MSVAAWRLMRDDKRRAAAARIAALVGGASDDGARQFPECHAEHAVGPVVRCVLVEAGDADQSIDAGADTPRPCAAAFSARRLERDSGGRSGALAIAAVILFVVLSAGWRG